MTGLESILSQIDSDARTESEDLLSAARAKAEGLTAKAREEASQKAKAMLQDGERRAQDIRDRAASAAQLERRNDMLAFKQQVIREAIEQTRVSLENAPANEYFETLLLLAARSAQKGKAEMRLNRRDLDRLPAGFEDELKKAAPQAEITVSKTPCDIASGFLLTYGGIDVNCTFQAIFEDAEGALRDAAGKILFPEP